MKKAQTGKTSAKAKDANIETVQEILDTLPPEVIESVFKERNERIKKLVEFKLSDNLADNVQALTRKELKALQKEFGDLEMLVDAGIEDEQFLEAVDKLAQMRGIEGIDDVPLDELSVWFTKVVYRTYNPLEYEGN